MEMVRLVGGIFQVKELKVVLDLQDRQGLRVILVLRGLLVLLVLRDRLALLAGQVLQV